MPHHTSLIATIVAGIGLAFIFGTLAQRLRLSPLVGYLLAGVLIGPFTPGYVADHELAPQLAEIGVILLMFGVGFTSRSLICWRFELSRCRERLVRSHWRRSSEWASLGPSAGQ